MKGIRIKARQLRRDQTDAEQRLWAKLRDRQLGGASFAGSILSVHSLLTFVVRSES
jgi:very-short-patch-repair endonuclease